MPPAAGTPHILCRSPRKTTICILHKNISKNSCNNTKIPLDSKGDFCYSNLACGLSMPKQRCDEAGDCSGQEVTSVEYVRYRLSWRYTIGRLRFSSARRETSVYRLQREKTGLSRPQKTHVLRAKAGLFFVQGLIRTAWWRKSHPYDNKRRNPMPPYFVRIWRNIQHGNRKEADPHPSQGL